ncbi:hypothetical protein [Spiroplasma endosymbiont of Polydrusus cervinus]
MQIKQYLILRSLVKKYGKDIVINTVNKISIYFLKTLLFSMRPNIFCLK